MSRPGSQTTETQTRSRGRLPASIIQMLAPWTQSIGQRACFAAGVLLVTSGLVHLIIWGTDGSSWAGDTSWRKPILFGFSAGVTVLSMGWLVPKLRTWFADNLVLSSFALAMLVEVGLITLQTWRGVASHFNRSTPFDALILSWIETLIAFATAVIAYLAIRCFGSISASADMRLAIRGGMVLLVFACLFGFYMVQYGDHRVASGERPSIYGKSGVMKFPHGMPIHAIQYLPALAWLLQRLRVAELARKRSVGIALAALILFTIFALMQTFGGRGRWDLTWLSGTALLLSVILLVASYAVARGGYQASRVR